MKPPSTALEAFAELAASFCRWCEAESLGLGREAKAAAWLARLHASALELPETDGDNADGLPEIPPFPLQAAERNLAAFNGWYYRTVFDPMPSNEEAPVMGDVGDDLTDTYKDVKAGILLFLQGREAEALWYWSFTHRLHWGRHAVGALTALHAYKSQALA